MSILITYNFALRLSNSPATQRNAIVVICYPAPELIYDIRILNAKSAKHHKFSL